MKETSVFVAEQAKRITELEKTNQRLGDLVRYKRQELLQDDLISEEEYAVIIRDSGAVGRLEGYDKIRAQIKPLEAKIAELETALGMSERNLEFARNTIHGVACKRIEELEAQLAEKSADAARLDWLGENRTSWTHFSIGCTSRGYLDRYSCPPDGKNSFADIRSAIDAARKDQK